MLRLNKSGMLLGFAFDENRLFRVSNGRDMESSFRHTPIST